MDMSVGGSNIYGGHGGWIAGVLSPLASLLFLWSMVQQHIPYQLQYYLSSLATRISNAVSPYHTITINEQDPDDDFFCRSEAYLTVEAYLSGTCASCARCRCRVATVAPGCSHWTLAVDDHQEVVDDFRGARIWWCKTKAAPRGTVISLYGRHEESRSYVLTFHRRHRDLVDNEYLPHVLLEGRATITGRRQRRLFTNKPSGDNDWSSNDRVWNGVKFEHPATFATLAMDPAKKQEILDDLEMFRERKEYYASIGKAWKRGYLLFGPPGTGKSTMIAAMANFLDYDVYDLELTAVKSNTELRSLFIETKGKSIILIEDIDCSIDLTGKRKKNKKKKNKKKKVTLSGENKDDENKVTLSGVLNFIDGLWSGCGGKRIIVFTTNHKENLDPALIRRGRMDMHIEMSYCCFESFKVLAKNYLGITDHDLFPEIQRLLGEVNMSPADVAEHLMPRTKKQDADDILTKLVTAIKEKALAGDETGDEDDSSVDNSDKEDEEKKEDSGDDDDFR